MTHQTSRLFLAWVFFCCLVHSCKHSRTMFYVCPDIYTTRLFPPLSPSVTLVVLAQQHCPVGRYISKMSLKVEVEGELPASHMREHALQVNYIEYMQRN